ncbi:hypothetical protein [Desulfovibrio gilichinskyi]|uniref:Uncharacterized protein n=1 Tax=Desulfovibrio gilichinskyi TaxID=1519643 RepID=A0A1X7DEU9_9BACT|nr:hypothetical protein [Desulfovibrio gilichinskyi]SMF14347.1 hypothetical protein SAMN06295933_1811 [Desulfovibrio gilichinskyi]
MTNKIITPATLKIIQSCLTILSLSLIITSCAGSKTAQKTDYFF